MTAEYRHNYGAFGRQVLNGSMMKAEMRRRAEKVKARFVETAPVSPEPDKVGEKRYKDSAVVSDGVDGGEHHDRAFGRVTVEHEAAMAIEFGHEAPNGRHVEGSYTLTNALEAAREG